MTHLSMKKSHERTPRLYRDTQFNWSQGSRPYITKSDYFGIWAIGVAIATLLALTLVAA